VVPLWAAHDALEWIIGPDAVICASAATRKPTSSCAAMCVTSSPRSRCRSTSGFETRLGRDPAMRWMVGSKAVERDAASTSQMGRFEAQWLASDESLAALGRWINCVHGRCSTSSVIGGVLSCARATFVRRKGGRTCSTRSWRAIESDLRRYFRADAALCQPGRIHHQLRRRSSPAGCWR
jgi:hypothetical protein